MEDFIETTNIRKKKLKSCPGEIIYREFVSEKGDKKNHKATVGQVMTFALGPRAETYKNTRRMLEASGMKVLRKIVSKTKVQKI